MQANTGDLKRLPGFNSAFPPFSAFYSLTHAQAVPHHSLVSESLMAQGISAKHAGWTTKSDVSPSVLFQAGPSTSTFPEPILSTSEICRKHVLSIQGQPDSIARLAVDSGLWSLASEDSFTQFGPILVSVGELLIFLHDW